MSCRAYPGLLGEIKARNEVFMKAFSGGNAAAASEVYAQDCKFMPHGKDVVNGRQGVAAYMKQDMDEGVSKVTLNTEEVNGSGDWAFERGSYRLDGARGAETGGYLCVWKKTGGAWQIYTDCFNVINPAQG